MTTLKNTGDQLLLKEIVEAVSAGTIPYKTVADLTELQALGLVEINPNMVQGDAFATRATQAGINLYNQLAGIAAAVAPAPVAAPVNHVIPNADFVLVYRAPKKPAEKKVKARATYPFEQMQIGQAFFVGATAESPKAARKAASAASLATKRLVDMLPARKFISEKATENGVQGVWIICVAATPEVIANTAPVAPVAQATVDTTVAQQ